MISNKLKLLLTIISFCSTLISVKAQEDKIHQIDSLVKRIEREHLYKRKLYDSIWDNYPNGLKYGGLFLYKVYYSKSGEPKKIKDDQYFYYFNNGNLIKAESTYHHEFYYYFDDSKMIKSGHRHFLRNIPYMGSIEENLLRWSKEYFEKATRSKQ